MGASMDLQRIRTVEDVEADLRETLAVVERLAPPDDLRQAVFNFAGQLITQRAMPQQAQPQAVMIDPRMLGRPRGH